MPLNITGLGLTNDMEVVFTLAAGSYGDPCTSSDNSLHFKTADFKLANANEDGTLASILVPGDALKGIEGLDVYYVCLRTTSDGELVHQGNELPSLRIKVFTLLLPIWVMVILLVILLCLSGLFSGKIHFPSVCCNLLPSSWYRTASH